MRVRATFRAEQRSYLLPFAHDHAWSRSQWDLRISALRPITTARHCANASSASLRSPDAARRRNRESAAMFYYGYLAAQTHVRAIDLGKSSGKLEKVIKRCSEQPGRQAFREALAGK